MRQSHPNLHSLTSPLQFDYHNTLILVLSLGHSLAKGGLSEELTSRGWFVCFPVVYPYIAWLRLGQRDVASTLDSYRHCEPLGRTIQHSPFSFGINCLG